MYLLADFIINGTIGSNCRLTTVSGDIKSGNAESNTSFKSVSGDIKVGNIGVNCSLNTVSGDVKAGNVDAGPTIKTVSGDIKVQTADKSVTLKTESGNIVENGVKRKNDQQGNTAPAGNMSFVGRGSVSLFSGPGGNRRIIVDGQDITHLVDSTSNSASAKVDEEPVRYTKNY